MASLLSTFLLTFSLLFSSPAFAIRPRHGRTQFEGKNASHLRPFWLKILDSFAWSMYVFLFSPWWIVLVHSTHFLWKTLISTPFIDWNIGGFFSNLSTLLTFPTFLLNLFTTLFPNVICLIHFVWNTLVEPHLFVVVRVLKCFLFFVWFKSENFTHFPNLLYCLICQKIT